VSDLTALRHELHRLAEPSDHEEKTAALVAENLAAAAPETVVTGLGGHGVAAVYTGTASGPTVLVRADLDALPLPDSPGLSYRSARTDAAHKCGHDGHMAMLVGVARELAARPLARGRAVLLFQPAEETGQGAARVLTDPRFAGLRPDRVLALHNLPGEPLGRVVLRRGVFASESRGMIIDLVGASAHAAQPHEGRSPAGAVARLIESLSAVPQRATALHEAAQVTVVGASLGGPAFGTSPGRGQVMATLRTHEPEVMQRIAARCEDLARGLAAAQGLACTVDWTEAFPATVNDDGVVDAIAAVATARGLEVVFREQPFSWSEDFGHFTAAFPGALFGLGAGETTAALHHPDYDFPDALLPVGVGVLDDTLRALLGG